MLLLFYYKLLFIHYTSHTALSVDNVIKLCDEMYVCNLLKRIMLNTCIVKLYQVLYTEYYARTQFVLLVVCMCCGIDCDYAIIRRLDSLYVLSYISMPKIIILSVIPRRATYGSVCIY